MCQVRVDGAPCFGKPAGEIAERMFGPAGTRINLSPLPGGFKGRMMVVEMHRKSIIQTPNPNENPAQSARSAEQQNLLLKSFKIQHGKDVQGSEIKDHITGSDIVLFIA
jgi:hypothetical protein